MVWKISSTQCMDEYFSKLYLRTSGYNYILGNYASWETVIHRVKVKECIS